MRRLMSRALQTAILYKDFTSTEKLLQYANKGKIVMHVFPVNIEFLVDQKQYNIISLLIFYQALLRTLISEKRPVLE
jgi:ornithine carbamoyltransferase